MTIDVAVLFRAIDGVITFALIGCLGYFLAKRAWFSDESMGLISRLITKVAVPAYLFHNITGSFSRDELIAMAPGVLPPLICTIVNMLIARGIARAIKSRSKGLFVVGFSFPNSINIGLPINLILFGPDGLPYVLLYFMANIVLFWSIGNYLIAGDAEDGDRPVGVLRNLGKIFSPPTWALLVAATVLTLRIPIPSAVANSVQMVGVTNSALIMITLGATIWKMGLAGLRADREMLLIILGRFAICPLVMIAFSMVYPMAPLMRSVFIIQSCMPVMSTSVMQAIYYKADVGYATRSVCTTTLLAAVTIPIYMVIAEGMKI